MTTGPGTGRLNASEVARALMNRSPRESRESIEVGQEARTKEWYVKSLVVYMNEGEGWGPFLRRMGGMAEMAVTQLPHPDELADELVASIAKGKP